MVHGLMLSSYAGINLANYHYLENKGLYGFDALGSLSPIPGGIIGLFTTSLSYFLQVPAPFLISSVLIKAILVYMVYRIFACWLSESAKTLCLALVFCLSIGGWTYGVAHIGVWGDPFFSRASASTFFLLGGILLFLKDRWVLGALSGAAAIHLHPLNSVAALAFFIPGLLFKAYRLGESVLKKFSAPAAILLGNILYILANAERSSGKAITATVKEWHDFNVAVEWDDMSLLFTFGLFGPVLITLLTASLFIVSARKMKKEIDLFFVVALFLLILFLGVEVLHYNGIFFGKLSEYFISVEFRRGVWVAMLFSFAIIADYLHETFKDEEIPLKHLVLCLLFINYYLYPSLLAGLIFFLALAIAMPNRYSAALLLLFVISAGAYCFSEKLPDTIKAQVVKSLGYVGFSTTFLSAFFYYFPKSGKIQNAFKYSIVLFLSVGAAAGVYRSKFMNDYRLIAADGAFNYPNLRRVALSIRSGKIDIDFGLIDKLKELNADHEPVLLPHAMSRHASLFFNMPVFLNAEDKDMAALSKGYYDYLKAKMSVIVGEELAKKELISTFGNELNYDDFLNNVSKDRLQKFYENDIRFVVINKEINSLNNDLIFVYENEKYKIYDLKNLS